MVWQESAGEMREKWPMMRLGDVCSLTMGQSPESSSYNDIGNGLPFYQGNADFGNLHPTARCWCNRPKKLANTNDVLISVRAPIGAVNIATEKCCIGRGLAALTAINNVSDSKYIYYALISKTDELNSKGTGSTFKAINKTALEDTRIPFPPLPEQRRIAAVLDHVSSLIALRKAQIAQLDLLVKARFVEMFGTQNEFDMWQCGTVADFVDVFVGVVIKPAQYYTDKEKGIPAFRSQNIGCMKVKDSDWVYFTEEGHVKNKKTIINENDVLVVRSGTPGTACVAGTKFSGYNAVDIIIARPNMNQINPVFLAMFTNMPHGMNQIREKTGGAAQQHFNIGGYKSLKIIRPPLDLQNRFSVFVEQTDKSKFEIQNGLLMLEILKKSLMQQYLG